MKENENSVFEVYGGLPGNDTVRYGMRCVII